jgi:AhpD family alkylhydroperoxidase
LVFSPSRASQTEESGETTLSVLQNVEWEPCLLEPTRDAELERTVRETFGIIPDWVPYFLRCPWIVRAFVDFENLRLAHTDLEFAEMIALVVGQENSCRYCYAAHRAILRVLGMRENDIRELEQELLVAGLKPRVKHGLDFVRRVARSSPPPSAADRVPLLAAGYTQSEIDEIAFLASVHVFANRLTTMPAIPPQEVERMPERWFVRVFRPLLAWQLRRMHRRRADGRPLGNPATGPFSSVVTALGDLPAARFQRRVLDEAWASPFLSRRAKALVFAVVARGLGCPLSECEAVRLLADEGLDRGTLDEILARLASPKLDPVESIIVPFARETIWYRPSEIQRQARAVRERLTTEQFVELIGTAALANAICRLSAALALPH